MSMDQRLWPGKTTPSQSTWSMALSAITISVRKIVIYLFTPKLNPLYHIYGYAYYLQELYSQRHALVHLKYTHSLEFGQSCEVVHNTNTVRLELTHTLL